ncbi:MAG TPA: outer membrane protein assembly factor BamA [Terrimicrobiaceae bacterium]
MRFCRHIALFLAVLAASVSLQAQAPGPIVRDIVVEYVGPPSISKARVIDNLATRIGAPYSERAAEADIRALYATGGVANVRIFAEPFADGVRVTVLLQGRPIIEEILIEGAEQIPLRRVRKEVSSKVGEVLSEEKLEADRQKILKIYEDRNYSDVDVQYRIQEIAGTNQVRVIFQITEGPRLVIRRINFFGNDSVRSRDLIKVMKTRPRNILTFFNKSGRLLPAQMEEDRVAIRTLYQNRGFADAEVTDVQTVPLEGTGVELNITIVEGIQYRVNTVKLEGVNIVPPDEIRARLKMVDGSLFTPKGMGDDLKTLRDFYGTRGYVDMLAVPEILPAGPGSVDVTYRIDEGVQSYVNLINIQGNNRTKDRVIRRELAVKPGEIFDTTLVNVSRQRLENLNYFSRVEMSPADTIVPGRKDLNVIVEEKRTGSFNFGAGFSTIDSLVGFAELQQSNFDLFNWPSFVGGGQRFRIRGQYGLERKDFVISLTEPWFLGYQLSVGVEGYYREANFLSDVYDQTNYGAVFQARKQLWRSLSGRVEYRIEGIRIFDVDEDNAGQVIQDSAGTYTKSAFSGSLVWDTRDSLFLTRRGEVVDLTAFISGGALGGTVEDYGISLEAAKYVLLPWDIIFLVKGELAVVDSYGGSDDVPIFDRLYLGGSNNLRGFDYREVGPVDEFDNPIGGSSLGYMTFEVTIPIISRVRAAIFSDFGFVNPTAYDFSTSNLNADIGVGLRLDLPIGPIRVDYGYPIIYDSFNGPPGKFNFNIGYQF